MSGTGFYVAMESWLVNGLLCTFSLTEVCGVSPDRRCGQLPPRRTSSIKIPILVTPGAIPLLAAMDFKLATSRRPAQAVGYPAQGRGANGNGGGTAGTPPVGVGAIGVTNSHESENPLLPASQRSADSPNSDPCSLSTAGSSPEPNGREGAFPDGSGTMPNAWSPSSRFGLKDRSFVVGTWNMAGQTTKVQGSTWRKLPFVEGLLKIEKIDLLVLTETHTVDMGTTKATNVLYHSGIGSSKAGVALIAPSDGGWTCESTELLVPGYAFLSRVKQKRSVESFWILCVYADNSEGEPSLRRFYSLLADQLAAFIASRPAGSWTGCLAAGDWNMVEYPNDRTPFVLPSAARRATLSRFRDVRTLCDMEDAAGEGAHPRLWTYRKGRMDGEILSQLDRVYIPQEGWHGHSVQCMDTNWSDHQVALATLVVDTPKVQLANPARRLPPLETLDKCPAFWEDVLGAWRTMTSPPVRVTLEAWTKFKSSVLVQGLHYSASRTAEKTADWKQALREEMLTPDRLGSVLRQMHHPDAHVARRKGWTPVWQEAIPSRASRPKPRRPSFMPSATSPWQVPVSSSSPKPGSPAPYKGVPRVADQLDARLSALRKATVAKMKRMAEKRTSEWFNLSTNQEMDERGSRASISVEGLRRPDDPVASTDLRRMTRIARDYFQVLHTPEQRTADRVAEQVRLLSEVRAAYHGLPAPEGLQDGPFSMKELQALNGKMPNTAPGPDGIPYVFWKALSKRLSDLLDKEDPPRAFWPVFGELTDDLRLNGTSRFGFKDANVSLFYKKGDPTLVANYRPISSINTDCKMFTNLVNGRLAPWAVAKLHEDQKGFVPGRQMYEHTRLAAEVAHLCDSTGTKGFIVGLDQAKAYDRVDQAWLMDVLAEMGVSADVQGLVENVLPGCRSRVRINGGYSPRFSLRRGVRQGDPLSCLLFNVSIEPLAMRLRKVVGGLSLHELPPAKVALYADDINLFLLERDSVPVLASCLEVTSLAIGSKFNLDKTDVKPVGTETFVRRCFVEQSMGPSTLPGAYILPPEDPLRILGVWVGDSSLALPRWKQIEQHVSKLIRQWTAIGASVQNRCLLAKALMQSRCYHLLDGNGVPSLTLNRLSKKISGFVRGRFSTASYGALEAPLSEGGLNCPSLITRKRAYDLRFLSHLVGGPQFTPWKVWTWKDLSMATFSNNHLGNPGLNPFTQLAYTKVSLLEPRVAQAFKTARTIGLDLVSCAPSRNARLDAPLLWHPALPGSRSARGKECLESHGVSLVRHVASDLALVRGCKPCLSKVRKILLALRGTNWAPDFEYGAYPPHKSVRAWPKMDGPLGSIRVFTLPFSLIATDSQIMSSLAGTGRVNLQRYTTKAFEPCWDVKVPKLPDIFHVWTDGSALNNGKETCTAGAGWVSNLGFTDCVSLSGITLSNNVAEVSALVLALTAWRPYHVVVHTDSSYALGLVKGGLLALERDGWVDIPWNLRTPPVELFRHLLFCLRAHHGSLSFVKVKAHSGDTMNDVADLLANEGRLAGRPLHIPGLYTPPGWVDSHPVLSHQPVSYLSSLLVRYTVAVPLRNYRSSRFTDRWTDSMYGLFGQVLDVGRYVSAIWTINVPAGLREVLWKEALGSLPFSSPEWVSARVPLVCRCGESLSLDHIFTGCISYDLKALMDCLLERLRIISPPLFLRSLRPDEWHPSLWYPLLALKAVEVGAARPSKACLKPDQALATSRPQREWAIGTVLWFIWKKRMKELFASPTYVFIADSCSAVDELRVLLKLRPLVRR